MINLASFDEIGRMAALAGLIGTAIIGGCIVAYIPYREAKDDLRQYINELNETLRVLDGRYTDSGDT